jgi:HAD superfamily hydrolase (TIGR01484 family)
MQPIAELPQTLASAIVGVAFDVDDTVTTHGQITPLALTALYRLQDAGIARVAVTGRSAAFGEVLLSQWPLSASIAENGAIGFVRHQRKLLQLTRASAEELGERRLRLDDLVRQVGLAIPGIALAEDSRWRLCDVAWDVGEFAAPSEREIRALLEYLQRAGARTTRSSIHVHATFEPDNKATGLLRLLVRHMGEDPTAARRRWAFVGDSGNDAAALASFELSCGVANVAPHLAAMTLTPRFITQAERGAGFAEFVDVLLSNRRVPAC